VGEKKIYAAGGNRLVVTGQGECFASDDQMLPALRVSILRAFIALAANASDIFRLELADRNICFFSRIF
jgi:hypothetical protein